MKNYLFLDWNFTLSDNLKFFTNNNEIVILTNTHDVCLVASITTEGKLLINQANLYNSSLEIGNKEVIFTYTEEFEYEPTATNFSDVITFEEEESQK